MDPVAAAGVEAEAAAAATDRHRPQCIISGSKLLPDVFILVFVYVSGSSKGKI